VNALNEKPNAEALPRQSGASIIVNGRYLTPPQDRDGKIWVRTNALVNADPDKLYELWRDVESAPLWQEQIVSVTRITDRISRWVMQVKDKQVEWDSEILADEPGRRIAWRSIAGDSDNAGEVVFERTPGSRGTSVTVLQEFSMSKLASAWETLTSRNPKQAVVENLRHYKALAECGEIPRTQGQSHGPRGLVGDAKASAYGEQIPIPMGTRSKAS
jgi:uncharacterized membrane protein